MLILKRILMILMFIASVTQAMASVVMPYNMQMQATDSMPMSMMAGCNESQMGDQQMSCDDERDCCNEICSLAFIPYAVFLSTLQPVSTLSSDVKRPVISTHHSLYRPPMLG